eukprot:TRINITY_DN4798_c0_g1_i7.p1 TRINITY_DN4798_c0_g1~~TRINITY_DN4798_c0_g1_i7.p1  ORF type:complete len:336 (-),score=42.86 TRINITY_DN4798_c0_g1_i7:61-1068(-)
MMIMVCKATMFGWCYSDGDPTKKGQMEKDREENKLEELPSLYHYLSYQYFLSTTIIGPAHSYKDFIDFMNMRGDFAKIPSPWKRFGELVLQTLFFIGVTLFVLPRLPYRHVLDKDFAERSLFFKMAYINATSIAIRCRYYLGFKLAQANITLAGISYVKPKGEEEKDSWERIISSKARYELSINVREKVDYWNRSVQLWLKHYVYLRFATEEEMKKSAKRATQANHFTFIMSALWHGLYPGYYLAFIYWGFFNETCRKFFKIRHKFNAISHPIFYPMKWFVVNLFYNYGAIPFFLLDLRESLKYMQHTVFLGPLVILFIYFLSHQIPLFLSLIHI